MNDNLKLRQVLQFLALEDTQKLACLPTVPLGKELEIFETPIRTASPLFCVGYECYACLGRNKLGSDEFSQVLGEMECLLEAMIDDERGYWIWGICSPGLSGSGHIFWDILRRLSREALKLQNWRQETPKLVLEDFIKVGQWVTKKQGTNCGKKSPNVKEPKRRTGKL